MKKRGILAVAILLVVLTAGVLTFSRPEKAIVITGNVSVQDAAEIKQAVRKAMRRRVFPYTSWPNIRAFPTRAISYLRQDVRAITIITPDYSSVVVAKSSSTNIASIDRYGVTKDTNGWTAFRTHDFW